MYCYVLERDGGLKSQLTGVPTSTGTSLMFLVLHRPSYGSLQGVEIPTRILMIPYPTTCLPGAPLRMGIFDVPTQTELWDFVGI